MNEFVLNGLVKRRAQLAGDIENGHEALRKMVLDLESLDGTHPASTPGRRDGLPRSAQAATAFLDCWFAFQFQGRRSATVLAG
jgi:hypothetical protein